ncbi:MAG: hypothetical protein D6780_08560 [Candidatus Dadabacteria bacterium]|nr:MAG: hypothetical protein D6780_08560 [Candidatus Dadabacteria bacterium]
MEHATPFAVAVIIYLFFVVIYFIKRAKREEIKIRKIPGVDAINYAVGRAAELGRPVSFTTGLTAVSPVLYAVLGVLHYVAKKAAVYKVKLLVPQYNPESMAIVENTVQEAYQEAGKLSQFSPQNIIFLSESQFAFASGYIGLVHRERVASAFLFGYFAAESLILAEAGQQIGAMQVGASVSPEQVPFFISTCDYTLIGEELFASSAYLTKEPIQSGSLAGQDRVKLLFFVVIIVGTIIATYNSLSSALKLSPAIPNLNYFIYYSWEKLI